MFVYMCIVVWNGLGCLYQGGCYMYDKDLAVCVFDVE